jgi:hypothetical protein
MRLCFVLLLQRYPRLVALVRGCRAATFLLYCCWVSGGVGGCDVTGTVSAMPMLLMSARDSPDRTALSGIREAEQNRTKGGFEE